MRKLYIRILCDRDLIWRVCFYSLHDFNSLNSGYNFFGCWARWYVPNPFFFLHSSTEKCSENCKGFFAILFQVKSSSMSYTQKQKRVFNSNRLCNYATNVHIIEFHPPVCSFSRLICLPGNPCKAVNIKIPPYFRTWKKGFRNVLVYQLFGCFCRCSSALSLDFVQILQEKQVLNVFLIRK